MVLLWNLRMRWVALRSRKFGGISKTMKISRRLAGRMIAKKATYEGESEVWLSSSNNAWTSKASCTTSAPPAIHLLHRSTSQIIWLQRLQRCSTMTVSRGTILAVQGLGCFSSFSWNWEVSMQLLLHVNHWCTNVSMMYLLYAIATVLDLSIAKNLARPLPSCVSMCSCVLPLSGVWHFHCANGGKALVGWNRCRK